MRATVFWTLPVLAAAAIPFAVAQKQDDFFDDSLVQELRIEIRPSDWASLKLHYLDNTYYPADFHWKYKNKDILVQDIGIRSRGRGSRSPVKPNIRIDFNRFEPDQNFLSLSSAVLKANNQDASMMKDRAAFKLFSRFGLPASRETHARVYVNDEYLGVCILAEEIKKEYLDRYLGEHEGDLFKFDPLTEGFHFEWRPSCARSDELACSTDAARWAPEPFNPEEHDTTYKIDPEIAFIRTINEVSDADFPNASAEFADLKMFLAHIAAETFLADYDGVLGDVFGMNNFYVYRYHKTNLHQFLVWDKDGTFSWSARPIFKNAEQNVFARRALALPERRAQYLDALYKIALLAGESGGWLEWELRRYYGQIRDAVYEDTLKQYSDGGVEKPSSNELFESEFLKNIAFVGERAAFVLPEVVAAGYQPSSPLVLSGSVTDDSGFPVFGLSPGARVVLSGWGFTEKAADAGDTPVQSLGGVSVVINGFFAPLYSVSANQIRLAVPPELSGQATVPVTVFVAGPASKGARPGSAVDASISNTIRVLFLAQ